VNKESYWNDSEKKIRNENQRPFTLNFIEIPQMICMTKWPTDRQIASQVFAYCKAIKTYFLRPTCTMSSAFSSLSEPE
jgi:hypothetical protein